MRLWDGAGFWSFRDFFTRKVRKQYQRLPAVSPERLIPRTLFAALGRAAIEEARLASRAAVGAEADQTVKDFLDEPDAVRTADRFAAAARTGMLTIAGFLGHHCGV
jgi:hypothetical protein